MTSEEIKQKQAFDLSTNGWLKEIALQLSLANEKGEPATDDAFIKPEVETPIPRVKRAYTKRT